MTRKDQRLLDLVDHASGGDSIWVCPQHGVVGTTHDPSCPETIRRYVAVAAPSSDERQP